MSVGTQEQIPLLPPQSHPPLELQSAADHRESLLRRLLPVDYDYAKKSGLIDLFYFNPSTGEDALVHILGGDAKIHPNGAVVVGGFHHEPSADTIWPPVTLPDGTERHLTRTLPYSDDPEAEVRPVYPMEPYGAFIAIAGYRKYMLNTHPTTGEKKLVPALNSMFPKEYDPLAVMQAVRIAVTNRDTGKDIVDYKGPRPVIITEGRVPLIDGKSTMLIKLRLDRDTGKVITAFPQRRSSKKPIMGLTTEQMWEHVTGE